MIAASATLLCAAHLSAQQAPRHDARSDRLEPLTRADLKPLEGALQAGPVALIEFADTDADELPGIHVATLVHAPAAAVMDVVSKPEGYARFMRTLDEIEVVERKSTHVVYDWRWQMALLTLEGRNAMTVYAPTPDRQDAGYRATIDCQSGDFGTGRISIRVFPRAPNESLLVISMRLDLRSANYVARQLARAARSINRSANMSLTYAMLLSFRHEAERRAGFRGAPRKASVFQKPALDPKTVLPLLMRGDLVMLDMSGDQLNQLAVFGLIHRKRSLVREVMLDANQFGSSLLPGSGATVVSREGPVTTFDWDIDLPLIGVSGRMKLRDTDPIVAVDAIAGALEGGRWHFEVRELDKNATMISGWSSFDVKNSTWFVRKLADADPYLGHGMSAASQVMLVRALRSRTAKRAEELARGMKVDDRPNGDAR
jgi:hypothetical protein